MLTTLCPLHVVQADVKAEVSLVRPSPTRASPPAYPDAIHVPQGCYISAAAYLAKFTAEFAGEFGAPVSMHPKPYPTRHTVALVTWRNEWWLRDEFLGVIRLNRPVVSREVTDDVVHHAEATLERRALSLPAATRDRIASFGLSVRNGFDASREIAKAAKLLPSTTKLFRIESRGREVSLLFFRPSPGCIAVYNPDFGTATAETTSTDDADLVAEVAEKLGYRVSSVRSDPRHLIAAVSR